MSPHSSSGEPDRTNSHALATVTARFKLHLHPSKSQDIMEGVREQLNMGLLRFSEDLGGVMLSYSDERVTGSAARLHPYFPFLAVTVAARVTLFRPRLGQHLVGRVIKVGADYIGLLVLGVFNAAVGAERIRREFKCAPQSGTWVSLKDASHRIAVGSYVRFTVDSVLDHGSMFSIVGGLQDPGTGLEGHSSVPAAAAAGGGGEQRHKTAANGWAGAADGGKKKDKQGKEKHKGKDKEKDKAKKKEKSKDREKEKEKGRDKEKKRKHSVDGGGGGGGAAAAAAPGSGKRVKT